MGRDVELFHPHLAMVIYKPICFYQLPLRLLHMMNVRFSLLNMAQRILGVTLPNF
jgi:hypothetical protein